MRRIFFIILLVISVPRLWSQRSDSINSLAARLETVQQTAEKVDILNELAFQFRNQGHGICT